MRVDRQQPQLPLSTQPSAQQQGAAASTALPVASGAPATAGSAASSRFQSAFEGTSPTRSAHALSGESSRIDPRDDLAVEAAFWQVLGEGPDAAGKAELASLSATLRAHGKSDAEIQKALVARLQSSPRFSEAVVTEAYRQVLGREPDGPGKANWMRVVQQLTAQGKSPSEIRTELTGRFQSSDEALGKMVDSLHERVFGRAPDTQTREQMLRLAQQLRAQGTPVEELQHRVFDQLQLSGSNMDNLVDTAAREVLGHAPDARTRSELMELAQKLRGEGKTSAEITAAISGKLQLSDESLGKLVDNVIRSSGGSASAQTRQQLLETARSMRAEGKLPDEIHWGLYDKLKLSDGNLEALATEAYKQVTGREPDAASRRELVQLARTLREEGKPLTEVELALVDKVQLRDENLGRLAESAYQLALGRGADPAGQQDLVKLARQLRDEGKSAGDIQQALISRLQTSDEGLGKLMDGLASYMLDGSLSPALRNEALQLGRQLRGEGKTASEIEQAITDKLQLSEPGLSRLVENLGQGVLGNTPDAALRDELLKLGRQLRGEGKSASDVEAALANKLQLSNEGLSRMVEGTYQRVLGRDAEPQGKAHWMRFAQELRGQGKSASEIQQELTQRFQGSAESHNNLVTDFYQNLFGKAPDARSLGQWTGRANELRSSGKSPDEVRDTVLKEMLLSPAHLDTLVEGMYTQLLGRASDAKGKKGWVEFARNLFNEGKDVATVRHELISRFESSPEFLGKLVDRTFDLMKDHALTGSSREQWVKVAQELRSQGRSTEEITRALMARLQG